MATTLRGPIPLAFPGRPDDRRVGGLAGSAERLGLALLVWAHRRRTATPRTIDPGRVQRIDLSARPFC